MTDGDFDCCPQLWKLLSKPNYQRDLWKRRAYQRHQIASWLCSVISLTRSRKISVLQTGLEDKFLMSRSLGLGRWHLWVQGKLKITRWDNNEYVIAVLLRRVVVKIADSTGSEISIFYWCFNGFGPYRRESRSKWSLCILEREHNLIKAGPVSKVFRSQEISSKYLFIYGFAEKFSTSCV